MIWNLPLVMLQVQEEPGADAEKKELEKGVRRKQKRGVKRTEKRELRGVNK
jgi:hypothetical protein